MVQFAFGCGVCQSDVQDTSGEVVSSCVYRKCKIALITYKFLLLQAISCHMAWLGRDFQCDFAPVAFVMFSHHVCIEPNLFLQM